MKRLIAAALALALVPGAARAFDYWLLALSWSPSWCATEARPGAEQCDPARDLGFVMHGLWPQHEEGWPEHCATDARDPSRRETAAMADVMGSGGLAWRQWQKHGRCSGLDPADYFDLARAAFGAVTPPPLGPSASPAEVAVAFVAANPALGSETLVVTCRDGLLREVRICLDLDLDPRRCAADVRRQACRGGAALDLPAPP